MSRQPLCSAHTEEELKRRRKQSFAHREQNRYLVTIILLSPTLGVLFDCQAEKFFYTKTTVNVFKWFVFLSRSIVFGESSVIVSKESCPQ
jgi:hypothetical protein